jgi:hypothetical protein
MLLLSATLVLLGFWLTIVWYFDIDGFRRHRRRGMSHEELIPRDENAMPRNHPRCNNREER